MIENEGERKSMRSNLLEKRRLQLELASYDAAKRNVATDMRKAQTDMRRRLQRYKNRLKDISRNRDDSRIISIEQFLERHRRKKKTNVLSSPRPHSSPLIRRMSKLIPPETLATDCPDDPSNPELFGGRRKSKVDLRPATACAAASRPKSTDAFPKGGGRGKCGKMGGTVGGAGSAICRHPEAQVRYFVEDELQDRASFYKYILDLRKDFQRQVTQTLKHRVAEFCGKPSDEGFGLTDTIKDTTETWRPMGMDIADLKQQVKLFVPRMKPQLQTERTKALFQTGENGVNKPVRIPNIVIHDPSDQRSVHKVALHHSVRPSTATGSKVALHHSVRPSTATGSRSVTAPRNNLYMPSEI